MLPRSFTFINLRNPHLTFSLVMLFVLSLVFLGIRGGRDAETWYVGAAVLMGLWIGWVWVQSRKIIVGPTGISYRTWRKGYTLPWEEIEEIGGILMAKDYFHVLPEEEMEGGEWMGQKYIYLSTNRKHGVPATPVNRPGFLYLQYRPEVWDLILDQLARSRQPRIRPINVAFGGGDLNLSLRHRVN